ncbi:hypothetical protein AK812_SmicGene11742 [Symbiodinium microadriaticum]|uniref:Uncharacterized protein n=1 Tax=Symbiodinium microadriaticum TaxID=2951 RepID=A0A1Q9ECG5_SYMMI|nr:hypothetical protein AK812_SmicGene11742 [Symbiodinium microadriaticum]
MDHVSWSVALVMSQLLIFRPITFLAEFRLYRSGLIPHTLILEKQSQFATRMQKQALSSGEAELHAIGSGTADACGGFFTFKKAWFACTSVGHPGCPTFPEQRLRSRGRDFSEVTSQDFRCQQGQSSFATQLCLLCFRSFFLRLWTLVNYGPLAVEWAKDAETLSSTLFAGWCTASGRFIAARMPPEQVPEQVLPGDGSIFGGVPATFSAHSMCLEPATHDQASPLGCDFAAAFGGALPGTRTPWILDTYGAVASGSVK